MNINQLRSFRKLPQHNKLIEIYVHGHGRWLFATDGNRAVGIKTDQYIGFDAMEDRHSNAANTISGYFSRNFKKLNSQHFMSWLFSENICSKCKGTKKIVCSTCDGEGSYDCEECSGNGKRQTRCKECDGNGTCRVNCDKCDADGEVEEVCNECDGTAKVTKECSECDGSGEDEGGSCSSCDGEGEIEKDCDDCDDGKIQVTCTDCDGDGKVDEDCENCDCGEVEEDCDDCDGNSTIECDDCDNNYQEDCKECLDLGRLFEIATLDLKLVKDLGMSMFTEVSVIDAREAVVFRGDGVMAVVMPYFHTTNYRDYKGE